MKPSDISRTISGQGMSGLGNIARIVFRVILAMVFVLITGEFLVRAFIGSPSTHVFDPEIGYAYQPNSEIFQVKEGVTRLHFNSLGLNDAEIGPKNGRCRVLVVGDSYATALQVPQSDNFTAVAERLDAKLDVVNAGRDGLFLGDLQKVSSRLVNKVHADFVVYVISLRAVEADIHLSGFRVTTDPQSGAVTDATMKVEDKEQLKQSFEWILQKSALVTRLAVQLKPALSDAQQSVATFLSWVSSTGKADTSDVKKTPSAKPSDEDILAFVFHRMAAAGPSALLYINQLKYEANNQVIAGPPSLKAEAVARRAAERAGIAFRDTTDYLIDSVKRTGQPPYGFDNALLPGGHLNADGHRAVGRALTDLVHEMRPAMGECGDK